MTDLETRLRESLHRAAGDAPSSVGLAARVRARRAPRRKLAGGVGAAVAAVAAVAAITVAPTLTDDAHGPQGTAPPTPARTAEDDGWHTITVAATRSPDTLLDVDVPPSWTRENLNVRPATDSPDGEPPGIVDVGIDSWGGYVTTNGVSVFVDVMAANGARSTARRVLASVRPAGEPAPDLRSWKRETVADEYSELSAVVPGDPRVRLLLPDGLPDCMSSPSGRFPARRQADGSWRAPFCRDRMAAVTAPTRALADVVAATVRGY